MIQPLRAHAFVTLIFTLALPFALFAEDAGDVKKELAALEGKWKAVSMEAGGKQLPGGVDFAFTVKPDGKATSKSSIDEYEATVTVDPKKSPKTIDNLHDTGTHKGKKQLGIYKLEGDKWTVSMSRPG